MTPAELASVLVDTMAALALAQRQLTERNIKLAQDRAIILRTELDGRSSVAAAERAVEMASANLLGDVERERGKIAALSTRRDCILALLALEPSAYAGIAAIDLPST